MHNMTVLLFFFLLGIDLEDGAYEDAIFMDAYWAACDHVCWANIHVYYYIIIYYHGDVYRTTTFLSKFRTYILTIWSSKKVKP